MAEEGAVEAVSNPRGSGGNANGQRLLRERFDETGNQRGVHGFGATAFTQPCGTESELARRFGEIERIPQLRHQSANRIDVELPCVPVALR